MAANLYRHTASEVLPQLRQGSITVEEYARSLLARIQDRDATVKAWVHLDPEQVIAQARQLDQIAVDNRGPLHGIAVGIKDIALTKDMPTRYNSPIYADTDISGIDAATVMTLRAAGALIIGKTHTTEFAATTVGGPCSNAHDANRTPGGSSSGSGAAVADFQVPLALGTQTGGSVIRPASFNGIYGFKPTWGAISREGLGQYSITCDTPGFFARSVDDLNLLASIFHMADDQAVSNAPFSIQNAKIVFVKSPLWPTLASSELKAAWEKAKSILTNHGAVVEDVEELPDQDFAKLSTWHEIVNHAEGKTAFLGYYLQAKDKLDRFITDQVENKKHISHQALLESLDGCARLRPIWDGFASQYDAVLVPSVIDEAPLGLGWTGDARFCALWTILHAPTLNVPGFAGQDGLPIGLTVVGPRYRDLHVLHAGKAIGKAFETQGGFISKIP